MVGTTTYSSVAASDGVKGAIIDAQRHWDRQKDRALKDELPLVTVVEAIISKVMERDPEAKWRLGLDAATTDHWDLHVYSDNLEEAHVGDLESMATDFEGEFDLFIELHALSDQEE